MARRATGCLALSVLLLSGSLASKARAQVDAEKVRQAIDRGVQFLRRNQQGDGRFPEIEMYRGGVTALCTLAVLNCGLKGEDEMVSRALTYLREVPPDRTYAVALQTMVFALASPKRDAALIRRNVSWLEKHQIREGNGSGGWSYPGNNPDNSNSQFALLALYEAERAGISAKEETWRLAQNYWQRNQTPEGSWAYTPREGAGTGSMTCAGISSLAIAAQRLGQPDAKITGNSVECCSRQEASTAVEKGLQWLGKNFSVHRNPRDDRGWLLYYLYGLERVGRLSAQRFLGGHDWYREGADMLVRSQDEVSGLFKGVGGVEDNPFIATSFALLFLSKGRRPVLLAKLEYDPDDDWNRHRHDCANLTTFVESRWQRDLTWQVIDARVATPDDLLEAPVLFLSGKKSPALSEQQARTLREYVNRGGFLFIEACCQGNDRDRGVRAMLAQAFPEPECKLRLLPPEHPIWHAEQPVDAQHARPLWGIDVGCRTSVVYCPEDLSCYWELARVGRTESVPPAVLAKVAAAQAIGINVLAYATNREVKFKLEGVLARDREPKADGLARAKLQIAKVEHAGGWNAAPGALPRLQQVLAAEFGMRVDTDRHELTLDDPALSRFHLLMMHGRNDFRLSPAEREALRTHLERGGMLMADAVCGSQAFAKAFRRELAAIWPDRPLQRIPPEEPLFSEQYGGFDVRIVKRRDPQPGRNGARMEMAIKEVEPELWGLSLDDRYAVIISPFDLSCALELHESLECRGYTREDAARLAINIVLYSLH